ncbi:MAG TPA: hypothetical protein VJU61_20075, partial [Polyangiaceae bacterium]|nr:hypothetical protein [Polyangiaceae bacterium]
MAMAQAGAPPAPAAPAPVMVDADPDEDQAPPLLTLDSGPRLERSSGFGIGLEAYGGLALLMTSDEANSHAMVGALSRVRFGFVQLGAVLELSDTSEGRWRSVGAFVGGYLPFRNWVDFDGAVGFAMRHHINPDQRYGSGGYDVNLPSVTLRLGFSDRTS